jgi:zinc protease
LLSRLLPARLISVPTRSTLPNGMRVVIIRNTLAPVATVEANFMVGGNETPDGFPGMAHAQEHMAFRGCKGMTADQTSAIFALLGGDNNADTQQNITQYFETVPSADVDVALEAQAACLRGIDDSQAEWDQERGAIEQEVARDLSNPTYKFLDRLNADLFAGTPYAHDALGTRPSFDKTTGVMLKEFADKWYTPSNMILIVVGDVDPAATLEKIKKLYGDIPSHPLPPHPAITLQSVKSESFTLDSNLPYVLGFVAWRMPGTSLAGLRGHADFVRRAGEPACRFVRNGAPRARRSRRSSAWVRLIRRRAWRSDWSRNRQAWTRRRPSRRCGRSSTNTRRMACPRIWWMRRSARKLRRRSSSVTRFRSWLRCGRTLWPSEGRNSPDEDVDAIRKVTAGGCESRGEAVFVQRADHYGDTLKPAPNGEPVAEKGFGGSEKVTSAPTKPVTLPDWAAKELGRATGADDLHSCFRHEAAEWDPPHRSHRHDQSHGHGDGHGEA